MTKYTPPTGATAAEAALRQMKASGVDVLFANPGTDFPSIIEAYAASGAEPDALPRPVICPHETLTVGMAHGYHLMTGKTAAVMVHVNVGLANSVMGLINAASENIPVLMCSGRTPLTEKDRFGARSSPIHWGQEMRDQAAMVRETVKWDYELRYPEQAAVAVDRAVTIAQSEPKGPVYLSLPREVLAEEVATAIPLRSQSAAMGPADPARVAEAAGLLAAARNPVIIAQSPDHSPAGIAALCAFAEAGAVPVVEYWSTRQALPRSHPCYAGGEPHALIAAADVIVVANAMVPWIMEIAQPPAGCKIIALGPDPLHGNTPMRGFPLDVVLTGGLTPTLQALAKALADQAIPSDILSARMEAIAAMRTAQKAAAATRGAPGGTPMTPAYVSRCLAGAADENTVFFNELGVDPSVMDLPHAGMYFSTPLSGGLGWGLTAALGAQLAAPLKQVIATVGDGSYTFANPVACHQAAGALGLPLLTVVFNNGIWNAVRRSTLYMYPAGDAAKANVMPITALEGAPDYAAVARAHGAHAERVADPADLPAAITRALAATKAGQQALLEVFVGI